MASLATFEFLPLGAILKTFLVDNTNIVLSFHTPVHYLERYNPYFGATIGRIANRIKDAKIDSLNGQSYTLAANNGKNSLHGGLLAWSRKMWNGPTPMGLRTPPGITGTWSGGESVEFTLTSLDGEEGFPGEVQASVVYTTGIDKLDDGSEVTVLGMEFKAELVGGAEETVVNMTNHSYFNLNLGGAPTFEGTEVTLHSTRYLPVDAGGIPLGHTSDYAGVEAGKPFVLGAKEPVVDDCFIFDHAASSVPIDTREAPLKLCVSAFHPTSKIHLDVLSTEPAFQFYTGGGINVPPLGGTEARGPRSGFCVEPSRYVNAPNVEEWKGMVTLRKGEMYGSRIVYRAWSEKS